MINVKLLVLFVCINYVRECYSDYCKICPRHTLCMYKNPGPGPYCSLYDNTALLTKEDVETIVNKINQRRNFVALGLARNLPSAANMNKMRWSEELAVAAQRWADQCDPAIRPDKKDFCRDMGDRKVGQTIATVTGLSPGLNVKSFVEMWYMQALEYTGSVTYYNQSEESKTNYFTQLIWAETALVGCGKARFSIDDKGTIVDRFVCNFAPKGNVRGKPVYTIGYPATQCRENTQKDDMFTGLCRALPEKAQKSSVAPTVSSLLRIINLPNNPMKLDIDPLRVDYKNREMNQDVLNFMKHQDLRHIPNNTRGLIHHVRPLKQQNLQELPNIPKHEVIPRQHPFEHPQNVHSAIYVTKSPIEQYRRNDYMREMVNPSYYDSNVKRRTFSGQCTRNSETTHENNACKLTSSQIEQCTRRAKKKNEYILTTQPCCTELDKCEHKTVHACNSQKPACIVNPTTTPYNCRCLNVNHPQSENHRRIPGEYSYYDYPNLALRGGEEFESKRLMKHSDSTQIAASFPQYQNDGFTDGVKIFRFNDQKTQRQSYRKNFRNRNNPHFINNGHRPKRQIERKITTMSFWKADKSDKRSQKRSRYTTLRNNIRNKFRTTFGDAHINTESITITVGDFNAHRHDSTDRSLSFDELMHFRKNRGGELDFDLRRKNKNNKTISSSKKPPKPTKRPPKTINKNGKTKIPLRESKLSTTTASTTVSTTVSTTTPTTQRTIIGSFSPQSACTRRITCTWTMPVVTDANGNVINGGGGSGGGGGGGGGGGEGGGGFPNGRTPWGHVENCTRRYTCSRLFYNRNVQASDTAAGDITPPDEDYCERRALNVKRKDSYGSDTIQTSSHHMVSSESSSLATPSMNHHNNERGQGDCFCTHQESRKKRSLTCKHKEKKDLEYSGKKKVPPNNLYYLAFSKILQMWENNRNKPKNYPSGCHCNASAAHMYRCHLFILLIFYVY